MECKSLEEELQEIEANEIGLTYQKSGDISCLLVSPDNYESLCFNLGLQMIYHQINSSRQGHAERSFLPNKEIISNMKLNGDVMKSIESRKEPSDFKIIGFSFSNPLQIINFFEYMELSNLHPLSVERRSDDPLVIAGGMGIANPEPFAPFIDLFVMGEGQETILRLLELYDEPKDKLLDKAKDIPGVYVPKFYKPIFDTKSDFKGFEVIGDAPKHIEPTYFFDLSDYRTASVRTTPNNGAILIDKGCLYRCSFCQYSHNTGNKYIPIPLDKISSDIKELKSWGVKQVYLLSASSTNHHDIGDIIELCTNQGLTPLIEPTRIDKTNDLITTTIAKNGDFFTLVADGSSERIRRQFGKKLSDEQIITTAKRLYETYGIKRFHLYEIINFFGEQEEDRINIAHTVNKILEFGKDIEVSLYINPVFPSPNTPYERFGMELPQETFRRIDVILSRINETGVDNSNLFKYYFESIDLENSRLSVQVVSPLDQYIEGITLRGDRKSGMALYKAYRGGLFSEGKSGMIQVEKLEDHLLNQGLDGRSYFREIPLNQQLPWYHVRPSIIDSQLDRRYNLLRNRKTNNI